MNKTLKTLLLSVLFFSIGACSPPVNPSSQPEKPARTDDYYEGRKKQDEDREDIIQRERDRYSGPTCAELDNKRDQDECEKMCADMYSTTGDKRKCEGLEVQLIEDLHEVYEKLESADDLHEIKLNLFKFYLSMSVLGLKKVINNYSENEAEDFLTWLTKDSSAHDIFSKRDKDYNMLESLLEQFDNDYNKNRIYTTFTEKLDGDELMQVAIYSDNSDLVKWFMDFIDKKNPDCDEDTETRACFEIYCKIGDDIDRDARDDWLGYPEFEEYIEDIIDEKVNSRSADSTDDERYNSNGWVYGRTDIKDLSDLNNDWVDELCHDLR